MVREIPFYVRQLKIRKIVRQLKIRQIVRQVALKPKWRTRTCSLEFFPACLCALLFVLNIL